jgi:hypothetical protein
MFFGAAACPDGWVQAEATQGRLLVGLPPGAAPGVAFGGAPLAQGERRTHVHAASGTVTAPPHGIALASGCCADGYGAAGDYPWTATSDADAVDFPYLQLLQCRKM